MSSSPYTGESIIVPDECDGVELDEFLCLHYVGVSKGFLRGLVREGRVLVDAMPAKTSQRLKEGQLLMVDIKEEDLPQRPAAPRAKLSLIFEDDDLLVVDKPAGIAVEPERWAKELPSLAGALVDLAEERLGAGAGHNLT